jgi:hypothetical protein
MSVSSSIEIDNKNVKVIKRLSRVIKKEHQPLKNEFFRLE